MKKFLVILAVAVSGLVFGQSEFEVVPQFKALFSSAEVSDLKLVNDEVSVYIYSGESVKEEFLVLYLNSFNFNKYLDTEKYAIEFRVIDDVVGSTQNPDDPNLSVTVVGYSESIVIKNISTNKAELVIDVFYKNYSSSISGVSVFTEDNIGPF
jgi:hypothetical protein